MCETNDCNKPAKYRVFWPSRKPLRMCTGHRDWAVKVAAAMSFYLHTERYPPLQENDDG